MRHSGEGRNPGKQALPITRRFLTEPIEVDTIVSYGARVF